MTTLATNNILKITKMKMDNKTKKKDYGAEEGDPSSGAAASRQAGSAASSSSNRGCSRVDRQAPVRVHASGAEAKEKHVDVNVTRSNVRRSGRRIEEVSDATAVGDSESIVRDELPLQRGSGGAIGGRGRSDDEISSGSSTSATAASSLGKRPYGRIAGQNVCATSGINSGDVGGNSAVRDEREGDEDPFVEITPAKRKREGTGTSTTASGSEPLAPLSYFSTLTIGQTTADLGAEIMREMEEVERIASTSKNLKGTFVRRLRLASRKTRAAGAELQKRAVVPSSSWAMTTTSSLTSRTTNGFNFHRHRRHDDGERDDHRMDVILVEDEEEDDEEGARQRERMRFVESEVSCLQETVERLTKEKENRERDDMERMTRMLRSSSIERGIGGRTSVGPKTSTVGKARGAAAPTSVMGSAPPLLLLPTRSVPSHLHSAGEMGSEPNDVNEHLIRNEGDRGESGGNVNRSGGLGPRDPLENLKALFLRKIEEVRQKLPSQLSPNNSYSYSHRNNYYYRMGPPETSALPIANKSNMRTRWDMSPSTAESSTNEMEFLSLKSGSDGKGMTMMGRRRNSNRECPSSSLSSLSRLRYSMLGNCNAGGTHDTRRDAAASARSLTFAEKAARSLETATRKKFDVGGERRRGDSESGGMWTTVRRMKGTGGVRKQINTGRGARDSGQFIVNVRSRTTACSMKIESRLPKVPRCTAVMLTILEGSSVTYNEAMSRIRREIELSDLGIAEMRPRRAVTGALILEITGDEGGRKASLLAERMADVLRGIPVRVSVPQKTAEMRVTGLDDSVTLDEVMAAVAEAGGCRTDEITVGELHRAPRGLTSVWLRCPLKAARRISAFGDGTSDGNGGTRKIVVGWSAARIRPLPTRRLHCFRCLEPNHVRRHCASTVDRSDRCYRCGEPGHRARCCSSRVPRCPLCADLGVPATHRMGSPACKPPPRRRKGMKPEGSIEGGNGGDTMTAVTSRDTVVEAIPSPSAGPADATDNSRGTEGGRSEKVDEEEVGRADREGSGLKEATNVERSRVKLLQTNLNRSRRAQDLMFQSLAERRVGLAVAAEPFRVPDASWSAEDLSGTVAVFWDGTTG